VKHKVFARNGRKDLAPLLTPGGLVYDLKGVLTSEESDARL
jgi:hypothetical protein